MPVLITTSVVEEIRELAYTGLLRSLPTDSATAITLPAVIELACLVSSWRLGEDRTAMIDRFTSKLNVLSAARRFLNQQARSVDDGLFINRPFELSGVDPEILKTDKFYLFQERFKSCLRQAGFGVPIAFALSGVLAEMVENVVQHSTATGIGPPRGVVGYCVRDEVMSFAVGDIGCGILASLRTSPDWTGLPDSAAALSAITKQRASRRIGLGQGEGFKQLYKSLVDLNGWVRFRTGDAFLELRGDGTRRRESMGASTESMGLQLAVTCSRGILREENEELAIDVVHLNQ